MGNPAARASIDKGAHDGPIQSGSPDVIIGGFPAARKGDPIGCSKHGSGVIVGGSATVFVNGMPLARQGDATKCNTSGSPAKAPDKTAPPQYWGATLAKDAGKDGMIHKKNFDGRVLGYYATQEDKTGDGKYDTSTAGAALLDVTAGNLKSQDTFRGEIRSKALAVNLSDTSYDGMSDIEGMNTTITATGAQFGVTGSAGTPGGYNTTATADAYVGTFEAKAISEVYKGNQGRWGFYTEAGAEAAAVKGEVGGNTDYWGLLNTEAKISGSAGSAGAAGGVTAYVDTTDYSATLKLTGEIAAIFGIKVDVGLKITTKPIVDWIWGDDEDGVKPDSGDGTIATGCATVLVGD